MSFTFEMDIGKGILAIDIYNFICPKQKDIGSAVLIYIAGQPRSIINCTHPFDAFNRENTDRCKYFLIKMIEGRICYTCSGLVIIISIFDKKKKLEN